MASDSGFPGPSAASPESVFANWLGRCEEGEAGDFAALCREHPAFAEQLRELHQLWSELDEQRRELGSPAATTAQLEDLRDGESGRPDAPLAAGPGERAQHPGCEQPLGGSDPSLGRYRPEGQIARGGMGEILRVWDGELGRHLAMKVMLAEDGESPAAAPRARRLERFIEEAQVTGRLDHPSVVPVHEMGLDSTGRCYFTMKLVEGRDLKAILDLVPGHEEGWSLVRALGVLLKVCEAMRYAHDKGVIHRDLKPANVMVGRYGEVYVMDWGLARLLGQADSKDIRLRSVDGPGPTPGPVRPDGAGPGEPDSQLVTMDGDVVGTPAYMPPEQALGHIAQMGPRSDVYAVGAMLYHLLSGQPPYVPRGAKVDNLALWQEVMEGPPQPLRKLAPEAPDELVAICEKAMARDPTRRYPGMAELGADLSAFLEGRVVGAFEAGAWAEARKWVRRNWQLAAALAAAVLLLVLGLIASSLLYLRAQRHAHEAGENLILAQQKESEALQEQRKVLRLADVKRLQEYEAQAEELWPAHPEKQPAMRAWLERARALADNLALHRRTLAELRERAVPPAAGADAEEPWRFGDTETQWQHDVLAELVAGLERFGDPDPYVGSIASVERRLADAQTIERRSLLAAPAVAAWRAAREAIARDPRFGGLQLVPQLGLLPIGPDPDTGLWEFTDLETGSAARRGADGRLVLEDDTGVVLVLLPGGEFLMGAQGKDPRGPDWDPDAQEIEAPVRRMSLRPFFIAKHELTQGQWQRMTGSNPSRWRAGTHEHGAISLRNPVESVTWIECARELARVGLRLPTEAQWEYAARGGTSTVFSTGDDPSSLRGHANVADRSGKLAGTIWSEDTRAGELDDGFAVHAPVGSLRPNPFGLHDVHGNVWEWCLDTLAPYDPARLDGDSEPPASPDGFRTIRGGAFYFPSSYARCARRYGRAPELKLDFLGLRAARPLDP